MSNKKVPDIGTKKEDVGAVQRTSEQTRRKSPEKMVCVAARSRGWRKMLEQGGRRRKNVGAGSVAGNRSVGGRRISRRKSAVERRQKRTGSIFRKVTKIRD